MNRKALLDILVFFLWGSLLLKFWLKKQLQLLIHPQLIWLVVAVAFLLIIFGTLKTWWWLRRRQEDSALRIGQVSLLPAPVSGIILIALAIAGFSFNAEILTSKTALRQGVEELLVLPPSQPISGYVTKEPSRRSLMDWFASLSQSPEPDFYQGQKVKISGFVVDSPALPPSHFLLCRLVLTSSVTDTYPLALPVDWGPEREGYPPGAWLEVEGDMDVITLEGRRQLAIKANMLRKIAEPPRPYPTSWSFQEEQDS